MQKRNIASLHRQFAGILWRQKVSHFPSRWHSITMVRFRWKSNAKELGITVICFSHSSAGVKLNPTLRHPGWRDVCLAKVIYLKSTHITIIYAIVVAVRCLLPQPNDSKASKLVRWLDLGWVCFTFGQALITPWEAGAMKTSRTQKASTVSTGWIWIPVEISCIYANGALRIDGERKRSTGVGFADGETFTFRLGRVGATVRPHNRRQCDGKKRILYRHRLSHEPEALSATPTRRGWWWWWFLHFCLCTGGPDA